jgi:hypothetical protein
MDNLYLQKHVVTINLIIVHGHRVVFRALYWFCDSMIEWVFNTLQTGLQMEISKVDIVFSAGA